MPSSQPLPPLPAADRPLLLRLIALNENYTALAAELASGSSPCLAESLSRCFASPPNILDLYDWADQPHIAPWLARHREMTDLQRRTLALSTLEAVIKASPTPIERRRARVRGSASPPMHPRPPAPDPIGIDGF